MFSCEEQLKNPNPSLYDEELWDAAKGQCSYFRTIEAFYVTVFSCTLSAISSILVIYIIFVSPTRLSSIYHRIILGLHTSLLVLSAAGSLATLPMPSPGDYWTDINNIQGPRKGNTQTCTAQGFVLQISSWTTETYLIGLYMYYLCAIGFKMSIETMTKYLEPLIHFLPITIALSISLPPLFRHEYNASFQMTFCIPWSCNNSVNNSSNNNNDDDECVGGGSHLCGIPDITYHDDHLALLILVCTGVIIFGLLCWKVYYSEQQIASLLKKSIITAGTGEGNDGSNHRGGSTRHSGLRKLKRCAGISTLPTGRQNIIHLDNGEDMAIEDVQKVMQFEDTKTIVLQAILYVTVALLQYEFWERLESHPSDMQYKSIYLCLTLLDGFFYFIIFVFHKVYNLMRNNSDLQMCEAIGQIFRNDGADHSFVMTRMHIVTYHHDHFRANEGPDNGFSADSSTPEECAGEAYQSSNVVSVPSLSFSFLRPVQEESVPFADNSNNDNIVSYGGASYNIGSSQMISRSLGSFSYNVDTDGSKDLLSYSEARECDRGEDVLLSMSSSSPSEENSGERLEI